MKSKKKSTKSNTKKTSKPKKKVNKKSKPSIMSDYGARQEEVSKILDQLQEETENLLKTAPGLFDGQPSSAMGILNTGQENNGITYVGSIYGDPDGECKKAWEQLAEHVRERNKKLFGQPSDNMKTLQVPANSLELKTFVIPEDFWETEAEEAKNETDKINKTSVVDKVYEFFRKLFCGF